MAAPSKTQGTVLLSHQAITHPATAKGSAVDVSTKIAGNILLFHAPVEAVANTNPGSFLIQTSASSTGDEDWATLHTITMDSGTPATEAMTATEPAGETVLAVVSTTGFAALDVLYIQDTTVVADSEWALCEQIVASTSIDLVDGLTNAKDSADVIWNNAEIYNIPVNLLGVGRVRVLFMHEGAAGADCHVKALMVTTDSVA